MTYEIVLAYTAVKSYIALSISKFSVNNQDKKTIDEMRKINIEHKNYYLTIVKRKLFLLRKFTHYYDFPHH